LTVTLIIEIPVLLMISGGSGRLCGLIGRSKFQLLMGLLPLSSAISGNVALQASNLTKRAVSQGILTPDSYVSWLLKEVKGAAYLGLAMGILLFAIAFVASSLDLAFGVAVMMAQLLSTVTAGCTGTLAPLCGKFFFSCDAEKWGGLVETALQDIIASFAMVMVTYRFLEFIGPLDVDPNDLCG
jgi:Mg/Co/Ni transporter MgtE